MKSKPRSKATLFQKYMVMRLNEIIFRKQLYYAFQDLKKLNTIVILPTTNILSQYEQRQYSVSLEIVRPKLRGEVIFKNNYDITKIGVKRKKIKYLKNISDIKLIDERLKEQEDYMKMQQTQNLNQLIHLQNFNKQKFKSPKALSQAKKGDGAQYIIGVFHSNIDFISENMNIVYQYKSLTISFKQIYQFIKCLSPGEKRINKL